MSISYGFILILIGCCLVTAIPRMLPFLVMRNMRISEPVLKWLSYIPLCIFSALVIESFISNSVQGFQVHWLELLAVIGTLIISLLTRSLLWTVILGVVMMALLRLIF
ncbi:AzlD domain-containing protein [Paenilisteria rocourtiae]|uniref:Branched-subunit amino acid transport protein n=2 Tax=Listeria rocourtiae TaxID=647910 RepID=A0A4R6ZNL4_9LIST|nr:AzlD domain-containing protein [Listeria rocourtiae]EUJ51060.1 Branched-chain amino acid transport protein (AzlD) [Listeria rocourtiae FSL F6-920]MBC1434072.1 AzlD domain-containing protein [Listeria rocourtiae]MBC1603596.1 AzlD domain-containing protein [Listeria rocourtiae]TDR53952.1 branched-subunit amino acid transport protein [Listeria rocourtiae]